MTITPSFAHPLSGRTFAQEHLLHTARVLQCMKQRIQQSLRLTALRYRICKVNRLVTLEYNTLLVQKIRPVKILSMQAVMEMIIANHRCSA
jgi:hypothetical protein